MQNWLQISEEVGGVCLRNISFIVQILETNGESENVYGLPKDQTWNTCQDYNLRVLPPKSQL